MNRSLVHHQSRKRAGITRHRKPVLFLLQASALHRAYMAILWRKERLRVATLVCIATLLFHHVCRNQKRQIRSTVSLCLFLNCKYLNTTHFSSWLPRLSCIVAIRSLPQFTSPYSDSEPDITHHAPPPQQQSSRSTTADCTPRALNSQRRSDANVAY